jgi:hypothetical protein
MAHALKVFYKGPIRKQLNEKPSPYMAAIPKHDNMVMNPYKFTFEYGRSGGIGARAEDGDLPDASPRPGLKAEADAKNIYARLMLTDRLMKGSKNNLEAFYPELQHQIENLLTDAKDMLARNIMTSSTGVFGLVTSKSGQVITLDLTTITAKGEFTLMNAFAPGQVIDTVNLTSGAVVDSGLNIVNMDYKAGTITIQTGQTIAAAAGNGIVLHGDYTFEMTGLQEILKPDSTIYTVDRSANKWFNPCVVDNSGTAGTPAAFDGIILRELMDEIEVRAGSQPDFLVSDPGVNRAFINYMTQWSRNVDYQVLNGGWKSATFDGIPFTKDKYFAPNKLGVIKFGSDDDGEDCLYLGRLDDWDWLDADGNTLARVADKAAWEATLCMYGDQICEKPRAQGVLTDIQEVSSTTN